MLVELNHGYHVTQAETTMKPRMSDQNHHVPMKSNAGPVETFSNKIWNNCSRISNYCRSIDFVTLVTGNFRDGCLTDGFSIFWNCFDSRITNKILIWFLWLVGMILCIRAPRLVHEIELGQRPGYGAFPAIYTAQGEDANDTKNCE